MPIDCGPLPQLAGLAFIIAGLSGPVVWWIIRPESRRLDTGVLVVWTTQLLIALLGVLVLLDVRWWCWITVSGSTWSIRLTALFMIHVGLLFTIVAMFQIQRAGAARTWPTTKGRILSSQIKASQTIGFYSPSATVYFFEVRYEYSVGARMYRGDRFAFGAKGFM